MGVVVDQSGVKINGQYWWNILLSQQMVDAIKRDMDDSFVFQQDSAPVLRHAHTCNTVQQLQRETHNFLSVELRES